MTVPRAYYNENDPFAAQWIRNLIGAAMIMDGDVDDRSIADVQPDDLRGYRQCHFFAGIAGWPWALRCAGWPDEREVWTGSCPCQGESIAGKKRGRDDPRHLWPHMFRLVRARRPAVVMGEQVARAAGTHWLDGVRSDMEGEGYAFRAAVVPSCAVDAPQRRDRLWWIGVDDTNAARELQSQGRVEIQRGRLGYADDFDELANAEGIGSSARYAGTVQGCPIPEWPPQQPERRHGGNRELADAMRIGGQQVSGSPSCDEAAHGRARWVACEPNSDYVPGRHDESATGRGMGDTHGTGRPLGEGQSSDARQERETPERTDAGDGFWSGAERIACHDGKTRRAKPGIPLLVDGVSGRVALARALGQASTTLQDDKTLISRVGVWRGFGNAIVPQVAVEVIKAFMECRP